jgi:hexosaminidase
MLHASDEFPGLVLRYTLDGTDPTSNSTQYTKPVQNPSKKVKVRAFDTNQRGSNF